MIDSHPSYIQFYPTLSCNLSCSFCFNKNIKPVEDIHIRNFERMVSVLSELDIPYIDIMGGEPTLHPHFLDLVELINSHGLKANISSNGTDIRTLEILSEKYGKESVRIGISVNSHELSVHLHDYIIKHQPVLKSIFDKGGRIPESCRSYAGTPGIDYFLLYMDALNEDDLKNSLGFYQYYQRLGEIKATCNGIDGVFCSGFIPDVRNYPELESARCPAGTTKLSVLPDGRVYPCYLFFRYPQFELGNILYDNFEIIWRHPMLNYFRNFDKNNCPKTGCGLFGKCHGGCPAMSYHFYKDLDGPDPRCMQDASCG